MSSDWVLEAIDLSKVYHLWERPIHRLLAPACLTVASWPGMPAGAAAWLQRRGTRLSRNFPALQHVGFRLRRGESLGIIGQNGSGKSTLLQILAGTLQPTSGEVRRHGKIAALLELGSGFNPEFTGRENVNLQFALAGLGPEERAAHFDRVAEFAAIGEFIDQPVRIYSSGMMIRLAFATQTVLQPDVFIVDEALAVGDVFFQAKCARFFKENLARGMSLLLVSHDLSSVKALCQQTLVLHEGKVLFAGPSAEAVNHYHHLQGRGPAGYREPSPEPAVASPAGGVQLPPGAVLRNWTGGDEVGTRDAEIVHCRLTDERGRESRHFGLGEPVVLEFYVRAHRALAQVQLGMEISNRHDQVIYGVTTVHLGLAAQTWEAGQLGRYRLVLRARMGEGDYLVDVAIGLGDRGDGAAIQLVHRVAKIALFSVRHEGLGPRFFGLADLEAEIDFA